MRHKKTKASQEMADITIDALFKAAREADKKGDVVGFIKMLLTESEQLMLGRRLVIARMLLAGLPQREIRLRLQVGPNTVWRVGKWLSEQIPEYGVALKKIEAESKTRQSKKKTYAYRHYDPLSFDSLKRKYPMHFLLFNIAESILGKK